MLARLYISLLVAIGFAVPAALPSFAQRTPSLPAGAGSAAPPSQRLKSKVSGTAVGAGIDCMP